MQGDLLLSCFCCVLLHHPLLRLRYAPAILLPICSRDNPQAFLLLVQGQEDTGV